MQSPDLNKPASFYAKLFSLTERRIQQLAKDGVIPKSARGMYPLVGTIKGYVTYLQERAVGTEVSPNDLQIQKVRLTKANADKVELEADILKGVLIPADKVEFVLCGMLAAFRAKMLALPTKSAGKVQNLTEIAGIEEVLRADVYDALNELIDYDPNQFGIATVQEDTGNSSTTTEADG